MKRSTFQTLQEVIDDDHFPEVDLALRRGRHIGRDDGGDYDFLVDAQDLLEPFYKRFHCELVQRSDGYFYLLPRGDRLGRRQLSDGEMLVGQTLALLYLDPATLQHRGVVERDLVLQRLSGLVGAEVLVRTLNPRKRRFDERVAGETVRRQVGEALRRLSDLGFVQLLDDGHLSLNAALMRFAEPVRGLGDPHAALEKLVAVGEVTLDESTSEEEGDEEDDGALDDDASVDEASVDQATVADDGDLRDDDEVGT